MQIFHKGTGRRRALTPQEWQALLDERDATIAERDHTIENLTHEVAQAGFRAMDQDRMLRKADNLLRNLAGQVVHAQNATKRAEAEQARLRQAVINARPRITPIIHHARVAPWAPGVLHVSDIDTGLHVQFADYRVVPPPIDPFRDLGGHRADGTDPETTLNIRIADLAGAL